jgi:hypothetical protein
MTYLFMRPFMKGFHMSAESWQGGRDAEGWKVVGGPDPTDANGDFIEELGYLAVEEEAALVESLGALSPSERDEAVAVSPDRPADTGFVGDGPPRVFVEFVSRVGRELDALEKLLAGCTPLMMPVRPAFVVKLAYGFMDASGEGFGSYVLGAED